MERGALESDYFVPASKITVLINTIAKMAKNPSIECELSQVLDDFLQKLGECDKYLENGIFNMNFAEAALLIQSSADLYSKKVDLLWDIIFDYQKRLLLSEEQNGDKNKELEKVEERKRKYKRKRKTNSDENESAKLVNSFSFGGAENIDYLNQNYEAVDASKEWVKFSVKTDGSTDQSVSKNFIFLPNNSVHNEDNEYIGRYDQFHSMSLIEEVFHLEKQRLLVDDHNCITKMRIDSYVINDFLLKKSIPSNQPKDSYSLKLQNYIDHFFESHRHPEKVSSDSGKPHLFTKSFADLERLSLDAEKVDSIMTVSEHLPNSCSSECSQKQSEDSTQICCKKSYVSLERLPFNIIRDKLRRSSLADSLFDDDHMSFCDHCPSPVCSVRDPKDTDQSFENLGGNLENRSKSCSQDSAFFEDLDDHEGEDIATKAAVPQEVASVSTTVEEASVETVENVTEVVENAKEAVENVKEAAEAVENVKEAAETVENVKEAAEAVENVKEAAPKRPSIMTKDDLEPQKKRVRKKRISAKALKTLSTGLTADYRDFEKFCREQYKASTGEGTVCPFISDEESEEEEEKEMSEDEENESPVNSDGEISEAEENNEEEDSTEPNEETPPELSTSIMNPLHTSTPRRPAEKQPFSLSTTDLEQEELSRKNVREWRSFIIPKLKTLDNRADFDIHEYGSRIIEPSEIGEQRSFQDLVKGKNASEVARYFIATLQLANTYNVEISGAFPNKLANETFQIKTLDKTKHHELLEEYQAPSEETFRERLERAEASRQSEAGPSKKRKLSFSARKLF